MIHTSSDIGLGGIWGIPLMIVGFIQAIPVWLQFICLIVGAVCTIIATAISVIRFLEDRKKKNPTTAKKLPNRNKK